MRSRVHVTVGRPSVCPSVCLSHRSSLATAARGIAQPDVGRRCRSIAAGALRAPCCGAGAQQQMRLASSWEPTEEVQRRLVVTFSPSFAVYVLESFETRPLTQCRVLSYSITTRNVRRILVRGSMPLAAWGEENCENLTTKWCILKYIWINSFTFVH